MDYGSFLMKLKGTEGFGYVLSVPTLKFITNDIKFEDKNIASVIYLYEFLRQP